MPLVQMRNMSGLDARTGAEWWYPLKDFLIGMMVVPGQFGGA